MSSYKHPTRSVMGRLDKLVRSGQILDASRRQKNQQKSPRSSVGHRRERGQGQAESFGLSSWRLGKLQAEQFGEDLESGACGIRMCVDMSVVILGAGGLGLRRRVGCMAGLLA